MLLVFGTHATVANETATPEGPSTTINIKKCRLTEYFIVFDVIRDSFIVGIATRALKPANKDNYFMLSSSLTASMAFMKFTQKENSVLKSYNHTGFYSSEYSKFSKKPLKKEIKYRYPVNTSVSSGVNRTFDPLSVYDHLRELACSGLTHDIKLNVKEKNEVTQYYFEYKGEQVLTITKGEAETILFVRTRKTSNRETSIWFDVNRDFLPVKIQQDKDGEIQAVLTAKSINDSLLE